MFQSFISSFCLAWQIEATKSKPIDNMIEASKNKRVTSLSCHVCHSETNDDCFRFNESSVGFPASCGGDFTMCMVKKFAFTSTDGNGTTTPMKTFSIKRNCSSKCEDGCVVMGERTRL
ncbi:unnamed protein product [Orchesella dallaii]|uniref:Secreted protein n=1 Tax=Orchesella dallaii TaxID=48710 RepID=A0ABP1RG06_9HEXA